MSREKIQSRVREPRALLVKAFARALQGVSGFLLSCKGIYQSFVGGWAKAFLKGLL